MTYTSSLATLSKFLVTKFEEPVTKAALGLEDVFYGDQVRIPRIPALCVEPGAKDRIANGVPRRYMTDVTIYLIVYHNLVASQQTNREANDELAQAIEDVIHTDCYFKDSSNPSNPDQVVDSFVSSVESGYQMRSNSLFRATRLTISARVQEQLPQEV